MIGASSHRMGDQSLLLRRLAQPGKTIDIFALNDGGMRLIRSLPDIDVQSPRYTIRCLRVWDRSLREEGMSTSTPFPDLREVKYH